MSKETKEVVPHKSPCLTLSNEAWITILLARNEVNTETAMMGITAEDDAMFVERVEFVKHYASTGYVEFDDDALAEFTAEMAAKGIPPHRCRRVWIHTHPGNSAVPSNTDWSTFWEHFDDMPWGVMLIVAQDNSTTCHVNVKADVPEGVRPMWFSVPTTVKVQGEPNLNRMKAKELRKSGIDLHEIAARVSEKMEQCCHPHKPHTEYQGNYYTGRGVGSYFPRGFFDDDFEIADRRILGERAKAKAKTEPSTYTKLSEIKENALLLCRYLRREGQEMKRETGDKDTELWLENMDAVVRMVTDEDYLDWATLSPLFKEPFGHDGHPYGRSVLSFLTKRYELNEGRIRWFCNASKQKQTEWLQNRETEYQTRIAKEDDKAMRFYGYDIMDKADPGPRFYDPDSADAEALAEISETKTETKGDKP